MRCVNVSTVNFSFALEPLISSLDPRVTTYIMGDFNINLLDHNLSAPVENFINQMISKNFLPIINRPTRVTPHSCTLIDNIFFNTVDEVESSGVITTNISHHYPVSLERDFQTYLKIQYQSTIEFFQMRTYQTLKIHYKLLTGTKY